MNAAQLLTHFDRLAEAPDAVPRLRRFILDLAVRGKLVEQDSLDVPAATVLKRIDKEKSKVVARGEVRQVRARVPIDPTEMTFKLPLGWEWTRFGDYASDIATGPFGSALHQSDYVFNGIPLVNPSHMQNGQIVPDPKVTVSQETATALDVYRMRVGDIVMARRGEVGRAAIVTQRESGWLCGTGSFYLRFATDVNRDYVILLLLCDSVRRYLAGEAVGTTMVNLNHSILKRMPLAIPPLAEQHRIVAKVDELMALCDQLEAAQQERERRRDRLAAASLQRLNQPVEANPATDQTEPAVARQQAQREQQKDHARFHLQNLNRVTTRPEHIKAMRQTFLNLAVRGKLLRQDTSDASAQVLLTQIEIEKSGASRKKLATKQASAESIEIPPFFGESLPDGWAISKLGDLCTKTGSGSTPAGGKEAYVPSGTPFLRSQNIYDDGLRMDSVAYISEATQTRMSATTVMPKDVLLNITGGSIGRCAIVPDTFAVANINQHVAIIRLAVPDCGRFIHCVIRSDYFQAQIFGNQTGAGREGLPKNRMDEIPIPVPPLAEQHRIVAKVDELMALCDQLEAQLAQSQTDSRRLLEAVLSAALEPVA